MYTYNLVNCDTDSITITKNDGAEFTEDEINTYLKNLNKQFPELIVWENDGYYEDVVVVAAKNYVLKQKNSQKIKYKGSSLITPNREPALSEMLKTIIEDCFISKKRNYVEVYNEYLQEALNIQDINRWKVKKSITTKLINSERKNETKVMDALEGAEYQLGDKMFFYNAIDGETIKMVKGEPVIMKKTGLPKMIPNKTLKLVENFDGNYDKMHYANRVYTTVSILKNLLNMNLIIKHKE